MTPNFYQQAVADLQRADISHSPLAAILQRYITQTTQAGGTPAEATPEEMSALLAQILAKEVPTNCQYNVYPFFFSVSAPNAGAVQTIVPQNVNRKSLFIQVGAGPSSVVSNNSAFMALLFESTSPTAQPLDASSLSPYIARSIQLFCDFGFQAMSNGFLQFNSPVPTNPLSIVATANGASVDAYGLIIEGT